MFSYVRDENVFLFDVKYIIKNMLNKAFIKKYIFYAFYAFITSVFIFGDSS